MRIAFFSDAVYPWHMGGLEAVERAEAEELAKHHRVEFMCMRWPGMQHNFTDGGILYHAFGGTTREKFYRHGRRSIRAALVYTFSTLRVFRNLGKNRFDIMEVNLFPFIHLPILKLYCKLTGCKMILDVVEVWSKGYWTEYLGPIVGNLGYWYTNYFCNSSNLYLVNSSITEEALVRRGIGRHRIFRFAPILDDKLMERIRKSGIRKERRVLFWGRFIKEKRLDKWLQVVKRVHKKMPSARGLLVGGGMEDAKVKRLVEQMGLGKIVDVRPNIADNEELFKEVARSMVLLQMSEREGLSIIALESLALGVPVVLPSYSPIPREVQEMCVVADEKEIPDRIIEIMKSRDRQRYMGKRENLSSFYISQTENFYARLFEKL